MLTVEKPPHPTAELLDERALVAELERLADQHGGNEQDLRRSVAKTLKAAVDAFAKSRSTKGSIARPTVRSSSGSG